MRFMENAATRPSLQLREIAMWVKKCLAEIVKKKFLSFLCWEIRVAFCQWKASSNKKRVTLVCGCLGKIFTSNSTYLVLLSLSGYVCCVQWHFHRLVSVLDWNACGGNYLYPLYSLVLCISFNSTMRFVAVRVKDWVAAPFASFLSWLTLCSFR